MSALFAILAAAAVSTPASCSVAWRDGQLVIEADRPIVLRQSTLREPERRILDLQDADLADRQAPTLIPVEHGGVRQVRIARHPESRTLRVVLDLDGDAALRTDVIEGGRRLVARLAWVDAGDAGPGRRHGEPIGPPAPLSPAAFIGPPGPTRSHAWASGEEASGEREATRSVPWPSVPQVIDGMRIRRLHSGATTVEIRGREPLMAWVLEELEPRRLTVRIPRSSLAVAAPRAKGAVERVTLRREPEAWTLALDLAGGRLALDSTRSPDGRSLTLRIEQAPALDAGRPVVVVDAGHGGYDPGALGGAGTSESQVALGVARHLAKELRAEGLQPVLTRSFDGELRLADREALIASHGPAAVISLHCNSAETPEATGVETYYRHDPGLPLARAVHERLVAATGRPDRGVRQARLFVLRHDRIPATLVEMGFLSNAAEERQLVDPAYQQVLARAIAAGVRSYLDGRPAESASAPSGGGGGTL
ncbi:MAG: N-acetylmuramoyl-L-alanine amidase [Candidatus Sericytochromatia bacterium]|nr:N-acetylmuramoyl-L-alanine amidase [Candidatus Tanganyikabacteria bacterium]